MELVKIRMLKHQHGQDVNSQGVSLPETTYLKGREYSVSESFARVLCEELGVAEIVVNQAPKEPVRENKDMGSPARQDKSPDVKKRRSRKVSK